MRITTSDIYEAGFLLSQKANLVEVWSDGEGRRRSAVFILEGTENLIDLQKSYRSGKAMVNLAIFRKHLEKVKDAMFRALRTA